MSARSGSGGGSRLVKLVGPSKAKRLVMTGEMVGADVRGLELGLVEEVHPAEELMPKAMAFAELLAKKAPLALGIAKLVINQCVNVDLETGRNFERIGQSMLKLSRTTRKVRPPSSRGQPQFTGR